LIASITSSTFSHVGEAVQQLNPRKRPLVGTGAGSAHHVNDLIGLDPNNFAVRSMQADPTPHSGSARGIAGASRPAAAALARQQLPVRKHQAAGKERNGGSNHRSCHDVSPCRGNRLRSANRRSSLR